MGKHKKSKSHKDVLDKDNSSSSSDEWVEKELVKRRRTTKKSRKMHISTSSNKFLREERRKIKRKSNSTDNSSSDERKGNNLRKKFYSSSDSDEHGHKKVNKKSQNRMGNKDEDVLKRESWMNMPTSYSTFTNKEKGIQREMHRKTQHQEKMYDPRKCSRELNPYWKDGGDGLPKFQKPMDDSLDNDFHSGSETKSYTKHQSGWRKSKTNISQVTKNSGHNFNDDKTNEHEANTLPIKAEPAELNTPITEKYLNILAGKLVKAEIMGNKKLSEELKNVLENDKKALMETKQDGREVIIIETARPSHSKPLINNQTEFSEAEDKKPQYKTVINTHKDKQRIRYFPDDDKYSLNDMFEYEKFNTGHDQDREFVKIVSNIRKNDDMEDMFTDNIRRKISDSKMNNANRNKAISDHQKMSNSLDNCSKCIQSRTIQKHLIVSLGEYIYLCLPKHEPLLNGHCLIVPIRHVSSITLLDENEWEEVQCFRKALITLFKSKEQEAIFFETAVHFHRYPHMVLECVPLPKEKGEMAPIYFKKAIDESETEWTLNKKCVSLSGRNIRRAIPKELPYFAVNFGLSDGFAHVIEDEKMFPNNFAQEIIGGILNLDHKKWQKPAKEPFELQSKRVLTFSNEWKDFDCSVKE